MPPKQTRRRGIKKVKPLRDPREIGPAEEEVETIRCNNRTVRLPLAFANDAIEQQAYRCIQLADFPVAPQCGSSTCLIHLACHPEMHDVVEHFAVETLRNLLELCAQQQSIGGTTPDQYREAIQFVTQPLQRYGDPTTTLYMLMSLAAKIPEVSNLLMAGCCMRHDKGFVGIFKYYIIYSISEVEFRSVCKKTQAYVLGSQMADIKRVYETDSVTAADMAPGRLCQAAIMESKQTPDISADAPPYPATCRDLEGATPEEMRTLSTQEQAVAAPARRVWNFA